MQRIRTFIVLAFLLFLVALRLVNAQQINVNGYIYDLQTNECLIGATALSVNGKTASYSNNYGYFSLTLTCADTLKVLFVGYNPVVTNGLRNDTTIFVYLLPRVAVLGEVTVVSQQQRQEFAGEAYLSSNEIAKIPAILGEKDVLKSFQTLPGIQGTAEGTSGIAVRGGSPDQNLILLDGIPVYNVNHLFGVFSVFNDDAINSASLHKAYLAPEFGGRLSSVLNITTKEGNNEKLHGKASIGLISSKLMIDGPVIKNKSSFLLSARRTYIDLLARPFIKSMADGALVAYHFYDINAKYNHKLNDKNRLFISYYSGQDKYHSNYNETDKYNGRDYSLQADDQLYWGNKTGSIRWNWIPNQKVFSNVSLSASGYKLENSSSYYLEYIESSETLTEENSTRTSSEIFDLSVKSNVQILLSSNFSIKGGLNFSHYQFVPSGIATSLSALSNFTSGNYNIMTEQTSANQYSTYFEFQFLPINSVIMNMGLRAALFETQQTLYPLLEPRVNFAFDLNKYNTLKLSYCKTSQGLQLLTTSTLGLPTDLWVPSMPTIKPSVANQFSIGWYHSVFGKIDISLAAYMKTMQNLVEFKDGASYLYEDQSWTAKVEQGNGHAYGAELMVKKSMGKFNGWISYTYSRSLRQFPTINSGNQFPYKYDRPHYLNLVMFYRKNEKIDYGFNWVFSSGSRTTLINENYKLAVSEYDYFVGRSHSGSGNYYHQRNGIQLPFYHRLDLSVNFHKEKTKYKRTWSMGLYNAYWKKNPWYIQSTSDGYLGISLLPIVPNVSYHIEF